MPRVHSSRAWRIHWFALAGLTVVAAGTLWAVWSEPAKSIDLRGFVTWFLLLTLIVYALVSTVLMSWVGRRTWGPIAMHGLALVVYVVSMAIDHAATQPTDAAHHRGPAPR